MTRERVLAIGLDGYEVSLERELIGQGELPAIARLRKRSARFLLDHGPAQRTGLAWEHFASALSPQDAGRWAAVHFDPSTYSVWQEGAAGPPWEGFDGEGTVVFDLPYFDLRRTRGVRGLVNWGAHDPGVATGSRPSGLVDEFDARFGPYPAQRWIYGVPWASADASREMGAALARSVDLRAQAAHWLLSERLPDWRLGLVVVSEPHSAIEGLWHGVDPTHPLHGHPSATAAGEGLRSVYRAVDRLVERLADAFPDARIALFALGGMGPNRSDVASMILLPDLMYRRAFGHGMLTPRPEWAAAAQGCPPLGADEEWSAAVNGQLAVERPAARKPSGVAATAGALLARAAGRLRAHAPASVQRLARRAERSLRTDEVGPVRLGLDWMPAARYRPYWHAMDAFALPSFYDGRIRVNLEGREAQGRVAASRYALLLDEIEALLRACTNPATGGPVVDFVERPGAGRDPRAMGATEADMVVVWHQALAFDHPTIGRVGPVPYRRSGGHTGPHGMGYFAGPGIAPGEFGVRSAFDVAPTVAALAGARPRAACSGSALPVTDA